MRPFDARDDRRSLLGAVSLVLFLTLLPSAAGAQEVTDFFTVTPCRLYDTRWGSGPLVGGFDRWIPAGGYCGIPPDATAATLNFTSVDPTGDGLLSGYPCCSRISNSVNGVQNGKNLACMAIIGLGQGGKLDAYLNAPFSTAAGLVVDVTGYFRPVSEVQQWREWEGTLTAPQDYSVGGGDPNSDVALDIRFTNTATGYSFVQPAIWDDDDLAPRVFKVYMAFPAGTWTWAIDSCTYNGVSCTSGWTPSSGTIFVQSNTASGNALYDRGFIEQVETVIGGQAAAYSELKFPDGSAFAWVGDTAWAAPPREKKGETAKWDAYLADRKSKGFTAVQIAPAVTWKPKATDTWRALPDAAGFSFKRRGTCTDETIPNKGCWREAGKKGEYWRYFKQMVVKANEAGLLVAIVGVMNPVGIDVEKAYPNTESAVKFAHYLKGLLGGQCVIYSPAFDDDPDEIDPATHQPRSVLMNAVGTELQGLNASGHKKPVTNHLSSGKSNCDEYLPFAQSGWMTHYFFQSGHGGNGDTSGACHPTTTNTDVQNAMMRARVMPSTLSSYAPLLPAINAEGPYDATNFDSPVSHPKVDTRYHVRQAGYLSALSNAVGYSYGAHGLSYWDQPPGSYPGEPSIYFTLPSASDMGILRANILGRHLISHPEWILTNSTDEKYKMVLATDEVGFVLAYLPGDEGLETGSSDSIKIDATKLPCQVCPSRSAAPWSFTWINITNGLGVPAGSCSGPAGGLLTFTRPLCSAGSIECDWLLKVEKTGACPTAVGATASTEAGIQAWTDTNAADGTSAVYVESPREGGWGEPVLVSPAGKAFQLAPRVSRLGGHHLVVWQADGLDGSLYGVYGALIGPRGDVAGPFKINHYTEHDQREPAVAGVAAGEALVVWSSYGQDGDQGGIFGRLVRLRGRGGDVAQDNLGEEFQISEEWTGHQQRPQVVADAGGYWVAWETLDDQGQGRSLSVRRLGLTGHPESPEVRLPVQAGEQRKLLTLDRPTAGSVVLRWWRQDARGGLREVLEQEVGPFGTLGPVTPGKG